MCPTCRNQKVLKAIAAKDQVLADMATEQPVRFGIYLTSTIMRNVGGSIKDCIFRTYDQAFLTEASRLRVSHPISKTMRPLTLRESDDFITMVSNTMCLALVLNNAPILKQTLREKTNLDYPDMLRKFLAESYVDDPYTGRSPAAGVDIYGK